MAFTTPATQKSSKILRSNLMLALHLAIEQQSRVEAANMYRTDSALLAGWKENYAALENGRSLEIAY